MNPAKFRKLKSDLEWIVDEIIEKFEQTGRVDIAICVYTDANSEIKVEHAFGYGVCECGEWADVCYTCYEAKCDNCEYRRQHF